MTKIMKWILALFTAALVLVAGYYSVSARSFPFKPGTNRYYYGYLTQGDKFGLKVGDKFQSDLGGGRENHLVFYGSSGCSGTYRAISGCKNDLTHHSYSISQPLYYGQVFVEVSSSGRITAILWNADAVPMK